MSKTMRVIIGIVLLALAISAPVYFVQGNPANNTNYVYLPIVSKTDPWAQVDPSGQHIIFWHQHSRDRETALQKIVSDFNATNPWGITVTAEFQGGYGDIFQKMLVVLNTPAAPDLVAGYQNQIAVYQYTDALVDMNSLVESSAWGLTEADKADFFTGMYEQDIFPTYDNARLGFPPNRLMEVLYYNQDWLAELGYSSPPTTTLQFQTMACQAAANPYSGRISDGSMGYMLSVDASRFASWVFAFGGDLYDEISQQYTLNSQEAVEAMTFLQNLFNDGCMTLVLERYDDHWEFGRGTLLFATTSSSGIPYYAISIEEGAHFNWSTTALPHTTSDPAMNIYGASISLPKHTSESELAAWLFLKYFTSTDAQSDWARATGYFPVRQSAANNLGDYFIENPQYADAFQYLPYGQSEPSTFGYDYVRDLIDYALADIVGGVDVTTRLNQLNADANAPLQ